MNPNNTTPNPFRNNEAITTLTKDDRTHILAPLERMNHTHYYKLSDPSLSMKPEQFRIFTHWLFNLPPRLTSNNIRHDKTTDLP